MRWLAPFAFAPCLAFALAGFAPRRQEQPPAPPVTAPAHGGGAEETPLDREMAKLEQAMQMLRRSLRDPAQDERSLEQIVIAQQSCLAAKQLAPRMSAHVEGNERTAFLKEYRKGVAAMLIEWARLETALLDGDRDAAQSSWKKLDHMEEDGHNRFTEGE